MTSVLDGERPDQLTTVWFFPTTGDLAGLKTRRGIIHLHFKNRAGSADCGEKIEKSACGRKAFPFSGIVRLFTEGHE